MGNKLICLILSFKIMKKPQIIIISMSLIISFFCLYNCSETTSPEETGGIYFPLNVGNYWVFNTYFIDGYGNQIIDTIWIDSIAVVKSGDFYGKTAYQLIQYRNNIPWDTLYYYQEGKQIYRIESEKSTKISKMSKQWLKIADFNNWFKLQQWHTYDTIDYDHFIVFGSVFIFGRSENTINSSPVGQDSAIINNLKIQRIQFQFKNDNRVSFPYKFYYKEMRDSLVYDTLTNGDIIVDTLKIEKQVFDSVQVIRTRLQFRRFWFSENIGIVQIQDDPYSEIWTSNPTTNQFPKRQDWFIGIKSVLIRYYIKK